MEAREVSRPPRLRGRVRPPGDKSISHRAAILNALAHGPASVENFLPGADCLATLRCLTLLGVPIDLSPGRTEVVVHGAGPFLHEPADVLDAANSGTTMRLLAGVLAGQPFLSLLTGDESLRNRPMGRVIEPLRRMGARIAGSADNTLAPVAIAGGDLQAIDFRSPVASAQVKSAVLLAALYARGVTRFSEPYRSRDHTERMLAAMGAPVHVDGLTVSVEGPTPPLAPLSLRVPGDVSGAAFWLVAGALHPDAEITVESVGVNPTRTGAIDILRAMGADLSIGEARSEGGEPAADITVRSSRLKGVSIGGELAARAIDELPVLALAAALAEGETEVRDAAELHVKESDRVATVAAELNRLGAALDPLPDGFRIRGVRSLAGAAVDSYGDHRLAMMLGVAGLVAAGTTTVQDAAAVAVSYPRFWSDLRRLSRA